MRAGLRTGLSFIGPYPYNPYLIFLFFFAFYFSRFVPVIIAEPRGLQRWFAAFIISLIAAIPSFLFALLSYLLQRFRRWSSTSLLIYLCEVAVGQSILFLCAPGLRSFLANHYHFKYDAPLTLTMGFYLGTLGLVLLALAIMNRAERTIANRLSHANKLVTKLEHDRESLINADEDVRNSTSRFLHDRVQSDLMVIGMELRSMTAQLPAELHSRIEKSISRLEKVRSSDLRNLVQILAPNFETGGLACALLSLKEQYAETMAVAIEVDERSEKLDSKLLLGVFRIVEQSLLNSLMHGPANRVQISLVTDSHLATNLVISDDGPGLTSQDVNNGVGTTIIDSWVGILKGRKLIDSAAGHGYRLQVTFSS